LSLVFLQISVIIDLTFSIPNFLSFLKYPPTAKESSCLLLSIQYGITFSINKFQSSISSETSKVLADSSIAFFQILSSKGLSIFVPHFFNKVLIPYPL